MLFGAFVRGKSAVENQPCSSRRVLSGTAGRAARSLLGALLTCSAPRGDPQRGERSPRPPPAGLGQPDLTGVPPCSPRPGHRSHHRKKKCLRPGQEPFLPPRDAASAFSPSFLPHHADEDCTHAADNVQKVFYRPYSWSLREGGKCQQIPVHMSTSFEEEEPTGCFYCGLIFPTTAEIQQSPTSPARLGWGASVPPRRCRGGQGNPSPKRTSKK